jgi:hypothetical protein
LTLGLPDRFSPRRPEENVSSAPAPPTYFDDVGTYAIIGGAAVAFGAIAWLALSNAAEHDEIRAGVADLERRNAEEHAALAEAQSHLAAQFYVPSSLPSVSAPPAAVTVYAQPAFAEAPAYFASPPLPSLASPVAYALSTSPSSYATTLPAPPSLRASVAPSSRVAWTPTVSPLAASVVPVPWAPSRPATLRGPGLPSAASAVPSGPSGSLPSHLESAVTQVMSRPKSVNTLASAR